jgi:predicted DNA-binding transcriptional regulator AlpA
MEQFINLRALSEMTGLAKPRLRRWLREGRGPAYKKSPSGLYLFRKSDVVAWVASLPGTAKISPSDPTLHSPEQRR